MKVNTRAKNASAALIALSLTGCSGIQYQNSATTKAASAPVKTEKQTPTQTINTFAWEGQRRELSQVIEEAPEAKPEFLRNVDNKKVDFWVNYFSVREKARFERFLTNGAKYRSTIERIFDDYGLPKELFFVGLIESGYYLGAKSHAGAVGPWQFIRGTAKRYGLKIRGGIDERRSIVKATEAAALYFQDLYNIFGNWELALSAYNAGEYGIVRRIRKAKTRDFYELSKKRVLPKETRHYIPKVLAAMKIVQNPLRYNIRVAPDQEDLYAKTKEVVLKRGVKLSELSQRTGISRAAILKLNPDLYWRSIPRVRGGYKLFLPDKDYPAIAKLNRAAPSRPASKKRYRVKRGDNLISIAKRHGVSLSDLKSANNIRRANHIRVGQNLTIPGATHVETYRVKRGDNLYELARRNHTSISKILRLNNLNKRTIYIGQKLRLPKRDKRFYTVRPGDYLLKIAKKHGTTVSELKKLNGVDSKIYPGQKLVVDIN